MRHAAEMTTAVRDIAPMLLMMIFPFVTDPLVTVSITILDAVRIVIVVLFVLMWKRAGHRTRSHRPTSQHAMARPRQFRREDRGFESRRSRTEDRP